MEAAGHTAAYICVDVYARTAGSIEGDEDDIKLIGSACLSFAVCPENPHSRWLELEKAAVVAGPDTWPEEDAADDSEHPRLLLRVQAIGNVAHLHAGPLQEEMNDKFDMIGPEGLHHVELEVAGCEDLVLLGVDANTEEQGSLSTFLLAQRGDGHAAETKQVGQPCFHTMSPAFNAGCTFNVHSLADLHSPIVIWCYRWRPLAVGTLRAEYELVGAAAFDPATALAMQTERSPWLRLELRRGPQLESGGILVTTRSPFRVRTASETLEKRLCGQVCRVRHDFPEPLEIPRPLVQYAKLELKV